MASTRIIKQNNKQRVRRSTELLRNGTSILLYRSPTIPTPQAPWRVVLAAGIAILLVVWMSLSWRIIFAATSPSVTTPAGRHCHNAHV